MNKMDYADAFETTRRRFLLATGGVAMMNAAEAPNNGSLAGFSMEGATRLEKILTGDSYRGRLESSEVAALMHPESLSRDALMVKLIPVAKSFAHPPISNYFVGAVVLGASGSLYLGCNIEIPGNMLGLATHGEQAAIANAYMSHESGIEAITVGGAPCGHCRQFLSEVSLEMSMRVIQPDLSSLKLSELLPRAFGPKNLGFSEGSFPVNPARYRLATPANDALAKEAWKAACASYSPYSRSPSGVALATSNGRIFAGSYIENAAFNPSLPPLESALAGYFAAGRNAGPITRAVLVEAENSAISHRVTTQSALAVLAPSARVETVAVKAA